MTDFVFDLPAPGRRSAADPARSGLDPPAARRPSNRSAVPTAIGRRWDRSMGIYSDLLVHDMGLALIDPMPAPLKSPGQRRRAR